MSTFSNISDLPEVDLSKCELMPEAEEGAISSSRDLHGWYVIRNAQSKRYLEFDGKWIVASGKDSQMAIRFFIPKNHNTPVFIQGEDEDRYLSYRNLTGAIKKYDEPTPWTFEQDTNNNWIIYSVEAAEYMGLWNDNHEGVYVRSSMSERYLKNFWFIERA